MSEDTSAAFRVRLERRVASVGVGGIGGFERIRCVCCFHCGVKDRVGLCAALLVEVLGGSKIAVLRIRSLAHRPSPAVRDRLPTRERYSRGPPSVECAGLGEVAAPCRFSDFCGTVRSVPRRVGFRRVRRDVLRDNPWLTGTTLS